MARPTARTVRMAAAAAMGVTACIIDLDLREATERIGVAPTQIVATNVDVGDVVCDVVTWGGGTAGGMVGGGDGYPGAGVAAYYLLAGVRAGARACRDGLGALDRDKGSSVRVILWKIH